MIERQAERLVRLADALLDVSRITAGRLELSRERAELAAIVREVVARHAEEATEGGTPLRCDVPDALLCDVDVARVEQVLSNLLSNAVKYGRGRPIEVTLRGEAGKARLSVRDHGIGIAEADQARIFERFERAVSGRNYTGLGLGLWIVRQIVEAHGGAIRVASAPDEGSTFVVELPLAAPA
jgi:signal transduction histidine kinase